MKINSHCRCIRSTIAAFRGTNLRLLYTNNLGTTVPETCDGSCTPSNTASSEGEDCEKQYPSAEGKSEDFLTEPPTGAWGATFNQTCFLFISHFISFLKNQKLRVTPLRRTNWPDEEPERHPVLSVTKLLPRPSRANPKVLVQTSP